MELHLQNKAQVRIADLLWAADSQEQVDSILQAYGHEARVVHDLMLIAAFDEVENTHAADRVIQELVDRI